MVVVRFILVVPALTSFHFMLQLTFSSQLWGIFRPNFDSQALQKIISSRWHDLAKS